jgi:hypothetical protein
MASAAETGPQSAVTSQTPFRLRCVGTTRVPDHDLVSPVGRPLVMVRRSPAARIVVLQHLPAAMQQTRVEETPR